MENRTKTILFIDDDEHRMMGHAEYLKLKGYDVIYVSYFKEAVEEARRNLNVLDLIILDIMVPVEDAELDEDEKILADEGAMSGFVLYDRISKLKKFKTLVLTVRNDVKEEVEKRGLEYLMKPIGAEKLASTVSEILKKD